MRRSLNGPGWTIREALGETWRWYVDKPLEAWGNNVAGAARRGQSAPGWWPASVPGSVVTDLWRGGEVPDPYRGRNSRAVEWTGDRSWVYRRTVDLPAMASGDLAVLEVDAQLPVGCRAVVGHRVAALVEDRQLDRDGPGAVQDGDERDGAVAVVVEARRDGDRREVCGADGEPDVPPDALVRKPRAEVPALVHPWPVGGDEIGPADLRLRRRHGVDDDGQPVRTRSGGDVGYGPPAAAVGPGEGTEHFTVPEDGA